VHAIVDEPNQRLVAFAAIDNLVKGAAGSAIQNLNAMRGFPETMGLEALPLWP
jgi:N-acetyl-gamma-glutamylphosphate reductase